MGRTDPDRKEIFEEYKHREPAFRAAMAVEAYMISLENLEYQNSRLAYELGKRVGKGLVKPGWMRE